MFILYSKLADVILASLVYKSEVMKGMGNESDSSGLPLFTVDRTCRSHTGGLEGNIHLCSCSVHSWVSWLCFPHRF